MIKHIQAIDQQQPTNFLSVFVRFVGLMLKDTPMQIWKSSYMFAFI